MATVSIIWLIVPSEDRALVLRIAGEDVVSFFAQSDDETSLPNAIGRIFQEQEYHAEPVLLAPCSQDVLAVSLPPDTSASRQAMFYELEEYVPIPAEQFTADFCQHEQGGFAGVIDNQTFMPFLDELATYQIIVQSIVPLSVLAAQYLTQKPESLDNGIRSLIWTFKEEFFDRQIEFFLLTPDGTPVSWQLLAPRPESLRLALEAEIQTRDLDIYIDSPHLPEELRQVLASVPRVRLMTAEPAEGNILHQAIARQSALILSHKKKPWWEFCRDQLAMRGTDQVLGKSVRMILWGAVVLTAAFNLVFSVRGFQYSRLETQYRQEQEQVFREALPEQKIQTGFRNRLESEYKKMSAQRENAADLPQRESALIPLLNVLQSLPPKVRYRFPEIRIEQNDIRLDGQLLVHGDAELIATALESGGFAIEPPSTQQTGSGSVSVRLTIVRQNEREKR